MPRVLILCEYPTLLGGERSMLAALPGIAAAGFEIQVAAPADGPFAAVLRENSISHVQWRTHDELGIRYPLEHLRADLNAAIRRLRPDLVHSNSLSIARIAGPVAVECGVPGIGHLRDIIKLQRQAIEDLNRHGRLLAVSQATRDFHIRQGIEATKCFTAFNGVDLSEYRPQSSLGYLHRELGLSARARFIAVIGQLGPRKGTDVALTAALRVISAAPNAHWIIVGERTSHKEESCVFERRLHSLAAESPLTGRVHFLGSREDIPSLLNECELLVHAARQEPLGRVLLEAAATGLAVVATNVGGTREIFPSEGDGAVLVPPENHSAMAEAILELLRNDNRRQAIAAGGRRRAQKAFGIRQATLRLVEHYQSALI